MWCAFVEYGKHVCGIKVSSPNLPLFPESIFFPDQPSFIISFLNSLPGLGRGTPGGPEFSEGTVSTPSQGEPHIQDLYSLLSAFYTEVLPVCKYVFAYWKNLCIKSRKQWIEVLYMGLPLWGGADCALRELRPSWGPPPQTRKTVEEWNDEGGLVRKKDAFREQWQIWGRDFNPTNVFPILNKCTPHIQVPAIC